MPPTIQISRDKHWPCSREEWFKLPLAPKKNKKPRVLRWRQTLIRHWREYHRMTLMGVADTLAKAPYHLTITHNSLGRLEHGLQMPKIELIEALAKIYGTDIDSMLNRLPTVPTQSRPDAAEIAALKIHSSAKKRLFLRENRKAKGVRPDVMAGRLGIERESLHRLEREWWRLKGDGQAAYADALGIEPEELWRLPSDLPSLDAMIKSAPRDVQEMATDIVRRLAGELPLALRHRWWLETQFDRSEPSAELLAEVAKTLAGCAP